jgi:glutamyl-tRNA reductase
MRNPAGNIGLEEWPIGIAGAGRVAQAEGRLLRERGQPVVAVASRTSEHARAAAAFIGGNVAALEYSQLPWRAAQKPQRRK